ncbi:transcriptional regulator, PucR family [Peptoclostridium litorale DSM 5388]|uniref:Purine catabolism regulatory protein PucR n=1 Tax=Peptoclostridium litorale DSM 5388 TaxID=1121324 RepID=A0A069RHN1_PEPLI|nr:PucR family transcriptional regulator [Peptoclostridium litorale]KDR96303.1 purine catabolism regulatory protein PucR [Peptoclostridium litorale DSM 5388]SIO26029.1 transcriptional regulator, PucR family [Peptoclostridium litorale DSM 5388]
MKILKDLFSLDIFKTCEIAAGKNGLDRPVEFVNISDTHDIAKFLKRHDLLLTTGYAFRDDPSQLMDFIRNLNNINVSGLIIKKNRFILALPSEVIELADELNFPILFFGGSNSLGDLSFKVISFLSDYKSEELFYAIYFQKKFTDMMLRDCSINHFIEQLSSALDCPVFLLDNKLNMICSSKNIGLKNQLLLDSILEYLSKPFNPADNKDIFIEPSDTCNSAYFSFFKVSTIYDNENTLVVLNSDKLVHPLSHSAIEQVINSLSFTLIKKQISSENIQKAKSALFFDLIYGNITNKNSFLIKASEYGLKENMKYICISGAFDDVMEQVKMNYFYQNRVHLAISDITEILENESKKLSLDSIIFTQNNYIIVIVQVDTYSAETELKIKSLLRNAQSTMLECMAISFGISTSVRSIEQIKEAYLDSLEALNYGYDSEKKNFIQSYKAKSAKDIFCMLPERTILEFSENILKDLASSSSKEHQELLTTLNSFIQNRFDISKTSRELFLHRNTVKYRISKCEELLDMDLRDYSDVFSIQIALEFQSLLKK